MTRLYRSNRSVEEQRSAFLAGEVPVAVYGLGKMGLPLAVVYAEATGNVVGVDVNEAVVAGINAGECHVTGEPGLPEAVAEQVARGALRATTDPVGAVAGTDVAGATETTDPTVHVVIVPTLLTDGNTPDLSMLEAACRSVARGIAPGDMVVVECTVPPGTCRDVVRPLVARESGLSPGEFGVAFCPERTLSGRALSDVRGGHPKIVGGVDAESTRVAQLIYEGVTANEVVPVGDATTAEAVKLFEGVYRDVNIALANELATLTDDLAIDVTDAIAAANTQPFCDIHTPGPGVGGHCIPYYPYFLMDSVASDTPLLRTARETNDGMPLFTARKTVEELSAVGTDIADATVLVLGLTYRPGVAEIRATPSKPLIDHLNALGARVFVVDPVLDDTSEFDATRLSLDEMMGCDPDAVVVVTPHVEFETIDWDAFDDVVIIDGRKSVGETRHRVYTLGVGPRPRTLTGDESAADGSTADETPVTDGGDR